LSFKPFLFPDFKLLLKIPIRAGFSRTYLQTSYDFLGGGTLSLEWIYGNRWGTQSRQWPQKYLWLFFHGNQLFLRVLELGQRG